MVLQTKRHFNVCVHVVPEEFFVGLKHLMVSPPIRRLLVDTTRRTHALTHTHTHTRVGKGEGEEEEGEEDRNKRETGA